ncbi:hypothetical protein V1387_17900 [Allomuricauda taeanensis]|uniref:hypothetical protein n=1 Tax=Flagellimonas taeanensis TaxID=1005926 RepID=UPI002E7AC986|nr:hypothetical protein [Allomuricauda taeanensis]MEE1964567.1 hypothetical protein [Allomuricauda taeanensis]
MKNASNETMPWLKIKGYVSHIAVEIILSDAKVKVTRWNATLDFEKGMAIEPAVPDSFYRKVYYHFNTIFCCINYGNIILFDELHGKFEHCQIHARECEHTVVLFANGNYFVLWGDQDFCRAYKCEDFHFLQGKLSMFMIIMACCRPKHEWLGFFHASAVCDGRNSPMILGNSGSGKSTALALLGSHGFTSIADDFVPMDAVTGNVYPFMTAISIKQKSIPVPSNRYIELDEATGYTMSFLETVCCMPFYQDLDNHHTCSKLLFIDYKDDGRFHLIPIPKIEAFQQPVSDSWLSGQARRAAQSIEWFASTETYQVVYNDVNGLVSSVKNVFNDEL